jgi:hypothetical protein
LQQTIAQKLCIFLKKSTKIQGNQTKLIILDLIQEKLKVSDALACGGHLKKVIWFFDLLCLQISGG